MECLDRAEKLLFQGERVIVDATFREESKRREFLELAARLAVPAVFIVCQADPEVVRSRLNRRQHDASDANWSTYQKLAAEWQEIENQTRPILRVLNTSGKPEESILLALQMLRESLLFEDESW
jgi:predicted kinase